MVNPVVEFHPDYPDRSLFIWPKQGYWLVADKDFWNDFKETLNIEIEKKCQEYKTIIKEFKIRGIIEDENFIINDCVETPLFFTPTKLVVSLTDNCNLKCSYCYASSSIGNNDFIKFESIVDALSFVNRFNKYKKSSFLSKVSFVGGEPFLHPDLTKILEVTYHKGFIPSITTNGTINISDNIISILKNTKTEVNISIDGHRAEIHKLTRSSSFDKILEFSDILISNEISVSVTTVVHSGNFPYLNEIIEFFYQRKFQGISLNTINQMGRGLNFENRVLKSELYPALFDICISNSHLKEFLRPTSFYLFLYKISNSLTQKDCGISNYSFFLNQDNNLYICGALKDDEFKIPYSNGVESIEISNNRCSEVIEKYNVEQIVKCKDCYYKYFCAGDCRGEANEVFKDNLEIHPDCLDFKQLYKEMMFKLSSHPDFVE